MKWPTLLIVGMLASAGTLFAENQTQNNPLNAVVKVECVSSHPNYLAPWQNKLQDQGNGSGVVIAGNRILTNAHNIADATLITLRKHNDDTIYTAKVEFVDHDCDLALLKVDDTRFFSNITPFEIGDTPPTRSQVYAVGFPIGGDGLSVTQGIISRIESRMYVHSFKPLLTAQLDAAINPGNSGGPIFYNDKVVGIAFQINRQGEGLCYMIHSDVIRHFLTDIQDGKVDGFGVLGFTYMSLENPDTRRFLKMTKEQTGVLIRSVSPLMPKDGIQKGDVLLAIDGMAISNNGNIRLADGQSRSFNTIVQRKQIGKVLNLKLLRNGEIISKSLPVRKSHYKIHDFLWDRGPEYYIAGGLVFTTLSHSFLQEWDKNPPANLTSLYGEEHASLTDETIVLTMVLSDEVNIGYQDKECELVRKVNGKPVHNLRELIRMVETCESEFITFSLGDDLPIILDTKKIRNATPRILERYRIPADRCLKK